jgi:hypothetical protein
MISYKTDLILNKSYPGLDQSSMMNLPFYEYLLKLKLVKEIEDESSDNSNNQNKEVDKHMAKYQGMSKSMAPKIPSNGGRLSGFKTPKLK